MSKKKVYAVRKGKKTGLFYSWDECKAVVDGFSGAEFKGFVSEEDAKGYLGSGQEAMAARGVTAPAGIMASGKALAPQEGSGTPRQCTEGRLIIYVDGSFDKKIRKYAYGCVILTPDGRSIRKSGNGDRPDALAIRNVAGEMLGAVHAVKWAAENGYTDMELRYDYEGIEKWATGAWRANNALTQRYAAFMAESQMGMNITFCKVKAHSGDYYNEQVDQLAKAALYS